MVRYALKFCVLLTLSFLLWVPGVHAQETDQVAKPAEAESLSSGQKNAPPSLSPEDRGRRVQGDAKPWQVDQAMRPAAPDVYLLPDASGKLRKVLGFRYEDFIQAWQRRNEANTAATPPSYVLDALKISGDVTEADARLRVELTITLQTEGWVDLPIQLPKFIVQQLTIADQAKGECLVFDKQRHGHVVWLSGEVGQKRKVVLEGLSRLKLNTGSRGVELHLPRATTSQFSLLLPKSAMRLECSPELALSTVAPQQGSEEEGIEVQLLGQANPLRLNWTPAEETASHQTALVEVTGETVVHLDRRRVSYTAQLQINRFESPLEQIQIRLPPEAKLVEGEVPSEYEIQKIDTPADPKVGQVLAIRRKGPPQATWDLQLVAERPVDASGDTSGDTLEWVVEGFEVFDAFRQSGTLRLEVNNQLQAYFETHGEIDQTPLPKSATPSKGRSILGQFLYTRFPWQVVVFPSPRQKQVRVTPSYQLSFGSGVARLEVEYDYQLSGAPIFLLRLQLHEWELTDAPIESGGLIDASGVLETREGRLILPFVDSFVDSGAQQMRLNLSFRRKIQLGGNTLFLPETLGAFVQDGELLVDSTEALQVTPKLVEMTGLSLITNPEEQSATGFVRDESRGNNLLRLRTFLSQPKFVAEITQRQLEMLATEQTTVDVNQQTVRVRQQIAYQAKYQPVSQLALSLPETLRSNDSLTITLHGEPVPFGLGTFIRDEPSIRDKPTEGRENNQASESSPLRPIIVSLPRPMQNEIPIEIAYELPTPEFAANESTPLLLPLAVPNDLVSSHSAVVRPARPVLVTLNQRSASDAWAVLPEETSDESSAATLRVQTLEKLAFLPLYAEIDATGNEQLATLERAWIQSWIAIGQRQERVVFRFRSPHATAVVQLPADFGSSDFDSADLANPEGGPQIEVLLDREPWPYEMLANNRLAVTLPQGGQRLSHTLELRYQQPTSLPSWGKLKSSLPRLECRQASAPIYWQLLLPRGWQVATSPQKLIPDYWLGWKNYRWGRQPTLSQAHLEQITSADSGASPTALSTQYVYRAFEIPIEIEVVVLRQFWLSLACALAAFGMGLLWFYTSLARSGLFWLGLALTLLLGIFTYPEVSLLATQVLLAGGLASFVMNTLRRVFAKDPSTPFPATSYPAGESSIDATETWQPQQLGNVPSTSETTATMPTSGGPHA